MAKTVITDKARQGRWGRQVLLILVGGLILAMVAWFIAENYGQAIERPTTETAPGAPGTGAAAPQGGAATTTQP